MLRILSFALICLLSASVYADTNNITLPIKISQNAFDYLQHSNKPIISNRLWHSKLSEFKTNYYYQWSSQAKQNQFCYVPGVAQTCQNVIDVETSTLDYYKDKTGYDNNYNAHSPEWLTPIAENMDLAHYPNLLCPEQDKQCHGIMVHNAQLRSMPSDGGYFNDFTIPGEGYPFDYIQLSDVWLGTPVMLLQRSKDHHWVLIKTQGTMGWVHSNSVAFTRPRFEAIWKHSQKATSLSREQSITKDNTWYLGSLLIKRGNSIGYPIKNSDHFAELKFIRANQLNYRLWPLKPNENNFGKLINALNGMPYGWGGMSFNSDCSGLMRRLFASFGIWLPRSSSFQADYAGHKYNLATEPKEERQAWLIEHHGPAHLTPLMSLVTYGHSATSVSHVSLYLGSFRINGAQKAIIFHAPWGLHYTVPSATHTGRAIVGHTVISSINLGSNITQAMAEKGFDLDTLWDATGFNITDMTQPYVLPTKELLEQLKRPYENKF